MSDADITVAVVKAEIEVNYPPAPVIEVFVVNPEITTEGVGLPGPRGPRGERGPVGPQGPPGDGSGGGTPAPDDDNTDEIWRPGQGTVQLREFDPLFQTERGILPFIEGTVRFDSNVDGTGILEFEIRSDELDWYNGWLAGIVLEVESDVGVWRRVATYSTRDDFLQRAGEVNVRVRAEETFGVWSKETLIVPEQMHDWTWRDMPDDREMGWMASAYDPATDKFGEPWTLCNEVPQSNKYANTLPKGFPKDTGAKWMSASGAWQAFQRKYFRAWITIPDPGDGTRSRVRFYLSAEETSTLYVAGSRVFEEEFAEGEWKNKYRARSMYLEPGTYAVGIVNDSNYNKGVSGGFKGYDPTLFAAGLLGDEGQVTQWLLVSGKDKFRACRRTDDPDAEPGRPPGPTPGEALTYLFTEARDRTASGWTRTTNSFSGTLDSKGAAWSAIVTEREWRVGDDYFDVLQALAETDDADIWIDPITFALHAAPARGVPCGKTWAEDEIYAMKVLRNGKRGTWAMGQAANGGWYSRAVAGFRREFLLTMGQAMSRWTAHRILNAALRDTTRWDAEAHLDIPELGWRPFIDFKVGDTGNLVYRGHVRAVRVQGIAAYPGDGGLSWRLDLTEDLPPVSSTLAEMR